MAERRARRRARREARMAVLARLREISWDGEDLEGKPTDEIVAALAALGVQTDEAQFRSLVDMHGSVKDISEAWREKCDPVGKWEAYPFLAARALWARWLPEVLSPEVFMAKYFPEDGFPEEGPKSPEEAQAQWVKARPVIDLVARADGPPRPDLIERLSEESGFDFDWWLGALPLTLAGHGRVDEAVEMCRRLAPVFEADNFLGDLAVILADAGRAADAVQQAWENLARFPGDVWIRIKAGDVYKRLGDLPAAEALYRRAYAMTDLAYSQRYDREGAVERLLDLYEETGRERDRQILIATERGLDDSLYDDEMSNLEDEAADDFEDDTWPEEEPGEDEELEDAEAFEPVWAAPTESAPYPSPGTAHRAVAKVGRNDPCPCGSGKKYKRCCGA